MAVPASEVIRVCLVGAESTGKTTLARDLAVNFETSWVPEYGRMVAERMHRFNPSYTWKSADFVRIAIRQCELEDRAALRARRVLVCDTDALSSAMWHRRFLGFRSDDVVEVARRHGFANHYLIAAPDIPFVPDSVRLGGEGRVRMHQAFIEELASLRIPYSVVSGAGSERLRMAVHAVESLLALT